MKYKSLLIISIFFALFIMVQILRLLKINRATCDGCSMVVSTRVWEPIEKSASKYVIGLGVIEGECLQSHFYCSKLQNLDIGDQIRVSGVIQQRVINDRLVLKRLMIQQIDIIHLVESSPRDWGWKLFRVIGGFRRSIVDKYKSYFSDPYADLMTGIVLGAEGISRGEFYDALIATGTVHVVAASGFNVSIVARVVFILFSRIWRRRIAIGVSLVAIALYVLLAGAGSAVVRAGIMGGLALAAGWWGREYWPGWALLAAASLMWLLSPWLITDISFQLSVSATAGVLWGVAPLERLLSRVIRKQSFVLSLASTTLAATLSTLPITLIHFDRISVISPLANVLVLELVPPLMGIGAVVAVVSLFSQVLGQVVAWSAWPLLVVFVKVVTLLAAVPGASQTLEGFNWWVGCGWWVILGVWWSWKEVS